MKAHTHTIAGKLVQGVTYDKILDDIRNSVSDNFKRIHLIQRKDINNIERAFKQEGGQRHHDDATSITTCMEAMRGMGDGIQSPCHTGERQDNQQLYM